MNKENFWSWKFPLYHLIKSNSISYTHVLKRDRLYKWTFVVIIHSYEDDTICVTFFHMESNFKNLHIYIYTISCAHYLHFKILYKFWKTPTEGVYKQTKCKQNMKQENRERQYSIWVNSSYIIQETSSLKPTFLREMKSIKILLCLNFLLKFFFSKLYWCLLPVPVKFWGNFKKK